jgi:CubicO group peptidase (beta-lactamase class C family)
LSKPGRRQFSLAYWLALFTAAAVGCGLAGPLSCASLAAVNPRVFVFGRDTPENQSVDVKKLVELTQWVKQGPAPILSILISRNGKVVYELYTSSVDPQAAHYLMSVTKSVLSALVGIAIDQKMLPGAEAPIGKTLPAAWFPDVAAQRALGAVSMKDVLGMSALDAPVFPHQTTADAIARNNAFLASRNRTQFALTQKILKNPGRDYLYTDVTCALASGAVECNVHASLFDYANRVLFEPMEFKNQDWMHQDRAGIDNGAYGLRLRPEDMQKFGILFLNSGNWEGKQLISQQWVETSFHPWIISGPNIKQPNYGWYWWQNNFGPGWTGHVANGWKGQRIAVFPNQGVVVTMTAILSDDSEEPTFSTLMKSFVIPAILPQGRAPAGSASTNAALKQQLETLLQSVHDGPSRINEDAEPRMIPSVARKGPHHPFDGP